MTNDWKCLGVSDLYISGKYKSVLGGNRYSDDIVDTLRYDSHVVLWKISILLQSGLRMVS